MKYEKTLILILCFAALSMLTSGCIAQNRNYYFGGWSPDNNNVQVVLDSSGSNRHELVKVLDACRKNPEKMQAAKFLISNLPPDDRATITADLLLDDIDFAFLARETMSWGKDISWSDFLHYVLPHRVSQEKAVNWRRPFYKEILPLVAGCKNIKDAILRINRWCFEKTGFKSTQRWDQNPLMTINRGYGRCEEAVILTVCALRAAGIPARQTMVPAWQHSNDNHTWTEVLIHNKWHFMESANPDFGLDDSWFRGSARKAPLVVSFAYGQLRNHRDPIQKRSFGCTILNSTARYAPADTLKIKLIDKNGNPVKGRIFISVYNYGSFRPVSVIEANDEGNADIILGPGSVLLSSADGKDSAFKISTWIPGEASGRDRITLRLAPDSNPPRQTLMRFSFNDKAALESPDENSEGAKKKDLDNLKQKRLNEFTSLSEAATQFSRDHGSIMAKSGRNLPEILLADNLCPVNDKYYFYKMLEEMPAADLCSYTSDELLDNLRLSLQARGKAESQGITYNNDIFEKFVLNPRILYEQPEPWRRVLTARFTPKNFTPESINLFCSRLKKISRGNLGSQMTPAAVLNSKKYSTDSEVCIFAVAALRSSGIPARALTDEDWIEFYDGNSWLPLFPGLPDKLGDKKATKACKSFYNNWATITFNVSSLKKDGHYPQYFKDFTISRKIDNSYFSSVENSISGDFDNKKNIWRLKVPKNTYWLIHGIRNSNGEALVTTEKINTTE